MSDYDYSYYEDSPTYIKLISMTEDNRLAYGTRIGQIKKDYKDAKKGEQVYIHFFKELTAYFLIVATYDVNENEFTPIDYKVFKHKSELTKYIKNIKYSDEGSHYQIELGEPELSNVFAI